MSRADRALAWWLLVGGLVGLVAAGALTLERIKLLEDPSYVPSCSFSPIISCGSVMKSWQGALLGFPNPLIGVGAFPVVVATGAALLAGAVLARWYWAGLQAGVTVGLVFVAWLISQSLYSIGALCPYCMVVWVVVIPTFLHVTLRNLRAGVLGDRMRASSVTRGLATWHAPVLLGTYLVVLVLILVRFWSYWSSLL